MNWERYILLLHKKLSNQISAEESKTLDDWRSQSKVHDEFLQEIEKLWYSSANYIPSLSPDVSKAKTDFFEKIKQEKKTPQVYTLRPEAKYKRLRVFRMAIAASVVLIIGSFFIYRNFFVDPLPDFMKTGNALVKATADGESMIELTDGTNLWLKPGSTFRYAKDYNTEDREVYLHGEMFISVVKDISKPFFIHMEKNTIQVLGTSFYIKSDDEDEVVLKVEEGIVQIEDVNDLKKEVAAGEYISYDKKSQLFVKEGDQNPLVTDWRKTYLIFENVPLLNVFDRLSVYYGVKFRVECRKIKDMDGFTSLVQTSDDPKIEVFINTIKKVYGIEIERVDEKTYKVFGDACK